jgi:hypothetical protein
VAVRDQQIGAALELLDECLGERGLPDAGLAGDEDDLALASEGMAEPPAETFDLGRAAECAHAPCRAARPSRRGAARRRRGGSPRRRRRADSRGAAASR